MIGSTDWTAAATIITSVGAAIAAIIAAWFGRSANTKVTTPAGTPPLGELGANVAAAVTTPPHVAPLGQVLTDVQEAVEAVHEAVNGKTAP